MDKDQVAFEPTSQIVLGNPPKERVKEVLKETPLLIMLLEILL